jgi:hypothetical protein
MPVIMREVSVAAGATDPNLLTGSTFEFMRGNVYLSIGVTAAATGTFITIISGSDIVLEESAPNVLTRYPVIPDEMYFNDVATLADRLVISARNPTGGAVIHRVVVQVTAL